MMTTHEVANKSFLEELGIDISTIKFIKSAERRARYQAVINWLTKYKVPPDSSALEKVQRALSIKTSAFYFIPVVISATRG